MRGINKRLWVRAYTNGATDRDNKRIDGDAMHDPLYGYAYRAGRVAHMMRQVEKSRRARGRCVVKR